jgi:hypothetical protein
MDKTPFQPEMSDDALNQLLAQASIISAPTGAEDRLLRMLGPAPVARHLQPRWALRAALPLAASLALGIYLGAGGYGDVFFSAPTTVSQDDEQLFTTGFEEAVTAAEDGVT